MNSEDLRSGDKAVLAWIKQRREQIERVLVEREAADDTQEVADLRKQLDHEKREHELTRGVVKRLEDMNVDLVRQLKQASPDKTSEEVAELRAELEDLRSANMRLLDLNAKADQKIAELSTRLKGIRMVLGYPE